MTNASWSKEKQEARGIGWRSKPNISSPLLEVDGEWYCGGMLKTRRAKTGFITIVIGKGRSRGKKRLGPRHGERSRGQHPPPKVWKNKKRARERGLKKNQ